MATEIRNILLVTLHCFRDEKEITVVILNNPSQQKKLSIIEIWRLFYFCTSPFLICTWPSHPPYKNAITSFPSQNQIFPCCLWQELGDFLLWVFSQLNVYPVSYAWFPYDLNDQQLVCVMLQIYGNVCVQHSAAHDLGDWKS